MRSSRRSHFVLAAAVGFACLPGSAQTVLRTSAAELAFAGGGGYVLRPQASGIPPVRSNLLWRLRIQTRSTPSRPGVSRTVESSSQALNPQCDEGGCRLESETVRAGEQRLRISVSARVTPAADEFRWTATITNKETDWVVREFEYPVLGEIDSPPGTHLYWPAGMGVRLDPRQPETTATGQYPGPLSMQWFALANSTSGLYVATEDSSLRAVQFAFRSGGNGRSTASVTRYPFAYTNAVWVAPAVIVRPYRGDWHEAARRYRRFLDQWLKPAAVPQWLRERTGWFLAILKQQNGDNMWRYDELDRIGSISSGRGLNMLGLFGWAHGGHDYQYPDYIPDPAMGGASVLKQKLGELRSRNMPAILYANGQLIDTSTPFYRYQGNAAVCMREDSVPYVESIRKFHSSTPVTFAKGDPLSPVWQERMLSLAIQAHQLGAAGILYDQLGTVGPQPCFPREGEQRSPADAWGPGRAALLARIAEHMRKVDPEFAILTEGIVDANAATIQFVHGSGKGFGPGPESFPELFRFTLPEVIVTQRHGTPMLDRATANWACLYGMRHEIEMRYRPDRDYLVEGKVPAADAYRDVTYYPPDDAMMRATPPAEATAYLKKLTAFEQANREFLMDGRFLDTVGLTVADQRLSGKVFEAGGKRAVLLWNRSAAAVRPVYGLEGATCDTAFDPEQGRVQPDSAMGPQSVRLFKCF